MKRRNFLKSVSSLSLPAIAGWGNVQAANTAFSSVINPETDKILVIVHLFGGNDGLNTVVPLDQFSNLSSVRGQMALPEDSLIPLTNTISLHPRMQEMQNMYNQGQLGIIQNVGYPNQNRSHFRSTDIWTSASRSDQIITTGWLGRYFDNVYPDYPVGFPNEDAPHPPAISISNVAHATCEGKGINFSQTVLDPRKVTTLAPGGDIPLQDDNYGQEMEFLRTMISQTNAYGEVIQTAAQNGENVVEYPSNNNLASQLKKVAQMISGGLQTKVYTVYLGGFDTHAEQTSPNTINGAHADLLQQVSEGIAAFQRDLDAQNLSERVLGMTFSEFGRRIRPNASRGTDHGDAGPMFFFGSCVNAEVIGDNPIIDADVDQVTGVPMQFDFRDIYGSVLVDWFGVDESRVRNVLFRDFLYLPIAINCSFALPVLLTEFLATPREKTIYLSWQTSEETDNRGFEVERSTDDGQSFEFLGWVPAVDITTGNLRKYHFEDSTARQGIEYLYRLKQIDTDGSSNYSPIRSARLLGTSDNRWQISELSPNPASGMTSFTFSAPSDGILSYELITALGQRILKDTLAVPASNFAETLTIQLGRAPVGAYTLLVRTPDGERHQRKLVIN